MVEVATRGRNPFDKTGSSAAPTGARYADRPESLVQMLRASVERDPRRPRSPRSAASGTYGSCGTAPPASPAGCAPGRRARRPRGDPAGQRARLGAGLLRHPAGRRGRRAGQHALQRARGRVRHRRLRHQARLDPGAAARRRARRRRLRRGRPRGDLLHQRHDRLPEGRDDHARELPDQHRERLPLHVPIDRSMAEHLRRWSRCRCSTSPAATAS